MNKCGGDSLWNNNSNVIEFVDDNLVSKEGSTITNKIDLSGISIPYKFVIKYNLVLAAEAENVELFRMNYGITFIAIVATYQPKDKGSTDCKSYVNYTYKDGIEEHSFGKILMLSSDCDNYLKNLILSNPSDKKVKLQIMIAYDTGADIENVHCDCH